MRTILVAALLAGGAAGPAAAAPDNSVMEPIDGFLAAFNKGDMKAAAATFIAGDVAIVDEFAPHYWIGPAAVTQWAADYSKHAASTGVANGSVVLGKPTRVEVEAGAAYVIRPARYTYTERGTLMVEDGAITFALKGKAKAWKIAAWTWSGPPPKAVK